MVNFHGVPLSAVLQTLSQVPGAVVELPCQQYPIKWVSVNNDYCWTTGEQTKEVTSLKNVFVRVRI